MKSLRAGLVGCGRIGALSEERVAKWPIAAAYLPYSHAAALQACPGVSFIAACDESRAAADTVAAKYAVTAYSSLDEMLAHEELDILSIATRTPSRVGVIEAAITHGVRALFCEKPIANSLEDTDRVAALIREHKVAFAYGTKRRFMPVYRQAKRLVSEGAIGTLETILVHFGRGALLWNHPHSVDIASFMAGDAPVSQVSGLLSGIEWQSPTVIQTDPILDFGRIVFSSGVTAFILPTGGQDVQLIGSKGSLTVESDGVRLSARQTAEQGDLGWWLTHQNHSIEPGPTGTVAALESLVRQLHGSDNDDGVAHAISNQEVLFALAESGRQSGAPVSTPVGRRGLTIAGITGGKPA